MSPSCIGGNGYAINFIDEFSGYPVVKFKKYKTQALQAFKEYVALPKILRTDNETEYKNNDVKKLCISDNIAREFTVHATNGQNGVAEGFNRTVLEAADAF